MQAYFLDTYEVEGARRIARKLSYVILKLSFEMFEDEFFIYLNKYFIFLDKFCWILIKSTNYNGENTFLTNFRDL